MVKSIPDKGMSAPMRAPGGSQRLNLCWRKPLFLSAAVEKGSEQESLGRENQVREAGGPSAQLIAMKMEEQG